MITLSDFETFNGKRVRTTRPVDNYPIGVFSEGLTGVCRVEDDCFWVKLDVHVPELAEWDNELQIWDWSEDQDGCWSDHPSAFVELSPTQEKESSRATDE